MAFAGIPFAFGVALSASTSSNVVRFHAQVGADKFSAYFAPVMNGYFEESAMLRALIEDFRAGGALFSRAQAEATLESHGI